MDGSDVYALTEAPDGSLWAGTNRGIFALATPAEDGTAEASEPRWEPRNLIANTITKTAVETHMGKRVNVEKQVNDTRRELAGRVYALDFSGDAWLASTSSGLLTSRDKGVSWQGGAVVGSVNYLSVAVQGAVMVAAESNGVVISRDAGSTWNPIGIPTVLTRIRRLAFSADGTIWLGAREGVYFSRDKGKTWMWVDRLPLNDVDDLYYDAHMGSVLVSSRSSDQIFLINPKTLDWTWRKTGYRVSLIRASGERLLMASLNDGVLVEPKAATATQAGNAERESGTAEKTLSK